MARLLLTDDEWELVADVFPEPAATGRPRRDPRQVLDGKGSVQGIFPLAGAGAGARITTAKFFSPNGHPISRVGITPDIDARRATSVAQGPESSKDNTHLVGYRGANDSGRDVALELAVQAVRNQPVAAL